MQTFTITIAANVRQIELANFILAVAVKEIRREPDEDFSNHDANELDLFRAQIFDRFMNVLAAADETETWRQARLSAEPPDMYELP